MYQHPLRNFTSRCSLHVRLFRSISLNISATCIVLYVLIISISYSLSYSTNLPYPPILENCWSGWLYCQWWLNQFMRRISECLVCTNSWTHLSLDEGRWRWCVTSVTWSSRHGYCLSVCTWRRCFSFKKASHFGPEAEMTEVVWLTSRLLSLFFSIFSLFNKRPVKLG